jgi:phage baseplate assembly protein W|tara:strand:+ start:273 stop:719 length:447 start_codon:yes stop_codon:yes gene_type:complete
MSTQEKKLYKEVTVKGNKRPSAPVESRAYRGISTTNPENTSFNLYDIALIKQDIINHFHIRVGEKLENPEFGTIIWDVIFEPMTELLREAIANNVTEIINYDPRVQVEQVTVDTYESGIMIECTLLYLPYNISESMRMRFDEDNSILT